MGVMHFEMLFCNITLIFSGFLVTYLTLKELAKTNGRVNWFLFYFHRFWRITPLYMVCLAIWATLIIHFGKGPNKDDYAQFRTEVCRDYWWANLLYIQNLYPFPGNLSSTVSMYRRHVRLSLKW